MTDEEGAASTEHAEEELEREADPGEPWAKTSSGDADDIADDDS